MKSVVINGCILIEKTAIFCYDFGGRKWLITAHKLGGISLKNKKCTILISALTAIAGAVGFAILQFRLYTLES